MIDPLSVIPPHSTEAEVGIIGCLLLEPTLVHDLAVQKFGLEWVYSEANRIVIRSIIGMVDRKQPVDLITLTEQLKSSGEFDGIGGISFLSDAANSVPSSGNFTYYLGILREKASERRLLAGCAAISADAREGIAPDVARLEAAIADARNIGNPAQSGITTAKAACLEFSYWLQQRVENKGKLSGVPTGIRLLDKILDGIQYAEFTLIAARPSIGKTALGCCVVESAINNQIPTLFVTAEMSKRMIIRRMIANQASVSMTALKEGNVTESEYQRITTAMAKISRSPLYFEEQMGGATISKLCGAIRTAIRLHGVKLVVIDYIQKFKGDTKRDKRTEELGEVCEKLQSLCRETGVAIVALAQISRDSEKEKKTRAPKLADLSDSKELEAHADTVVMIHRERGTSGEAELIIGKQRDGECGTVKCHYEGQYCRFANLDTSVDREVR